MSDVLTGGASGALWDNLTETAYNRAVDFALRDVPQWREVVDTKPNAQAMPGDIVTFTLHLDLAAQATTPLTETTDVSAVGYQAPTRVPVTLNEYGNATITTLRLDATSFTKPEMEKAVILGRNMVDSIDTLVRTIADGSTNVAGNNNATFVGSGATAAATKSTDLFLRMVAAGVVTLLRRDKVTPKVGEDYVAITHPDVLFDLMNENSATAWIAPHTYGTDTEAVYAGEVGRFMGARYIRTTRVTTANDGTTAAKVYRSYIMGQQAIAEAAAVEPHIVVGPQTDHLKRFNTLGWYGLLGWALYRPQALRKVYTSSSLGAVT